MRPEVLLKGERVLGDFEGGEGHDGKCYRSGEDRFRNRCFAPDAG